MKKTRLIILLMIVAALSCSKKSTEPLPQYPKLSFAPANLEISSNQSTRVNMRIDNFTQLLFGASFQITFNSSKISVADSLASVNESIFGGNTIRFIRVDSSTVHLSITRIQGDDPVSGSGIICGLHITGNEPGVCSLAIAPDELYFYDIDGDIVTIDSLEITPAIIRVN